MASVLFGAQAGLAVLPLMVFHQMQLMVCAVLAKRFASSAGPEPVVAGGVGEARRRPRGGGGERGAAVGRQAGPAAGPARRVHVPAGPGFLAPC